MPRRNPEGKAEREFYTHLLNNGCANAFRASMELESRVEDIVIAARSLEQKGLVYSIDLGNSTHPWEKPYLLIA